MPGVPPTPVVPAEYLTRILEDSHARALALITSLAPDERMGPQLDIINPPLWEVGHVAWFHENFVLRRLDGHAQRIVNADALYDSMTIQHADRWTLPLPDFDGTLAYLNGVRDALIERIEGREPSEADSYLHRLTVFHADMHNEAMTCTRQTLGLPAPPFLPDFDAAANAAGPLPGDVGVPGSSHRLGAEPGEGFAFDNEKWAHPVEVPPFAIARAPVTNAEFAAFVDDGGYSEPRHWSEVGWRWRVGAKAEAPVYWRHDGAGWQHRRFDRWQPLPPHEAVIHVNWYEAEAWCRWAGRRLPDEAEWEVAASREPDGQGGLSDHCRLYPWGDVPPDKNRTNLDYHFGRLLDVAALPAGDSALGCRQMMGSVWEWTASPFGPFAKFSPDAYVEYSEPWFPEGRPVLRGGGWASCARMLNNTHRNFFTPERRDIIAGFRSCAL